MESYLEKRMNTTPRAFVLNQADPFPHFSENLYPVLSQLGCRPRGLGTWKEGLAELDSNSADYPLWILDLGMKGFSLSDLEKRLPKKDRPRVVLVELFDGEPPSHVDERLDASARVAKSWTFHELAFVLRRVIQSMFLPIRQRRRNPRTLLSAQVEFIRQGHALGGNGSTFNMSAGGFFLATQNHMMARSQILDLTLDLRDGPEPIECTGEVLYVKEPCLGSPGMEPPGMGIEIRKIDSIDRWRMCQALDKRYLQIDRSVEHRAGTPCWKLENPFPGYPICRFREDCRETFRLSSTTPSQDPANP